jgi:hypothetical protein
VEERTYYPQDAKKNRSIDIHKIHVLNHRPIAYFPVTSIPASLLYVAS